MALRLVAAAALLTLAGAISDHQFRSVNEEELGCYADKKHMIGKDGAPRMITLDGHKGKIVGKDTKDGDVWEVTAVTIKHDESHKHTDHGGHADTGHEGDKLTVDFSSKGGPKNIVGEIKDQGKSIAWSDGNTWTKADVCKDLAKAPAAGEKSGAYDRKLASVFALAVLGSALA